MREKGGDDLGKRYFNFVIIFLRRRVSRRERGGVRIRDRVIYLLRFFIIRRVYVKVLRKIIYFVFRFFV